jgi:hypothetical protein
VDVGSGSNRELFEALMGPQPSVDRPAAEWATHAAQAAGLTSRRGARCTVQP